MLHPLKQNSATSQQRFKSHFSIGLRKIRPNLANYKTLECQSEQTTGHLVENLPPNFIYPGQAQNWVGASKILPQNHARQLLPESSAAKQELGQCSGVSCPVLLSQSGSREDVNEEIR